jgi:ribosome-binding protein aMBF1 (putative translation factor)
MPDRSERPPSRPGGLTLDQLIDQVEQVRPGSRSKIAQDLARRGPLGNQLNVARLQLGLTQVELAERTGIAQSDISAYENGDGNPTASTLQRLANALGFAITFEPDNDQAGPPTLDDDTRLAG